MFSLNVDVAVKLTGALTVLSDGTVTDCEPRSTNRYSARNVHFGANIHSMPPPAAQPVRLEDELPVAQVKFVGHVPRLKPAPIVESSSRSDRRQGRQSRT